MITIKIKIDNKEEISQEIDEEKELSKLILEIGKKRRSKQKSDLMQYTYNGKVLTIYDVEYSLTGLNIQNNSVLFASTKHPEDETQDLSLDNLGLLEEEEDETFDDDIPSQPLPKYR